MNVNSGGTVSLRNVVVVPAVVVVVVIVSAVIFVAVASSTTFEISKQQNYTNTKFRIKGKVVWLTTCETNYFAFLKSE